jgi:hypothetical protein
LQPGGPGFVSPGGIAVFIAHKLYRFEGARSGVGGGVGRGGQRGSRAWGNISVGVFHWFFVVNVILCYHQEIEISKENKYVQDTPEYSIKTKSRR